MNAWFDKAYEYLLVYGIKILSVALVFFIGKWCAKLLANILETAMTKAHVDSTLTKFLKNLIYFSLLVFVVIMALGQLGIQTTSFIAVMGAAGLAIGLALQGSLSSFAAGFLLILFRPFKTGDFIEAGGVSGIVSEIQIFNTIIQGDEGKIIIVPNSKITADKITVHTKASK